MKQVAVIGLGQFGRAAAEALAAHCEVLAMDRQEEKVDAIKDAVTQAVSLDVTDRTTLEHFLKSSIDCVIISLGDDLESAVLATLYAREIGVERIIVKSNSPDHSKILSLVGATQVVFPEEAQAKRLARTLIKPNLLDYVPLTEGYSISEVAAPATFEGKTLKELDLRNRYGVSAIAIRHKSDTRRTDRPQIAINLSASTVIEPGDVLIVIGPDNQIARLQDSKTL